MSIQDFLVSKGFFFVLKSNSDSFGDKQEVLRKQLMEIRIINDRGNFFVELRNIEVGDWFDLPLILESIGYKRKDIISKTEVEEILKNHLPEVEKIIMTFSVEEMNQLKKQRMKRRLPGISSI